MSKSRKRAVVLFEAMNKTPLSQSTVRRGGIGWLRRESDDNAAPMLVAEALTEEEAAVEIAREEAVRLAEREEIERVEQERVQRREAAAAEKAARRAERRTRRAERRANRAEQRRKTAESGAPSPSPVRFEAGRIFVSAGPVTCIVAASVVCAVGIGGFAMGRRVTGATDTDGRPADPDAGMKLSPLLGASKRDSVAPIKGLAKSGVPAGGTAKLDEGPAVSSNRPARVSKPAPPQTTPVPLNFLQIEWFPIQRHKTADQVRAEVRDVQQFLERQGIRTVARRHARAGRLVGFLLFSEEGVRTGSAGDSSRKKLKSRIQSLGRAYRKEGGLYEFKGCFFVNAAEAQRGERVDP